MNFAPGLRAGCRHRFPPGLLFAALLAVGGTGCQEVPVTGRSALSLVKHEDVVRAGGVAFEKLKHDYGIVNDRVLTERLRRIGERLSKVAFWDVPDADWEFVVLNAPNELNAHSCAGGKVAVTSAFFKIVDNDDQLAWVVAHEISHLAARHSDERYSRALIAQGGALVAAVGLIPAGPTAAQAGVQAYQLSAAMMTLAYGREQELEADYMGLVYMARAGYNPEEGARAFQNMVDANTAAGKPIPAAIFSTHPTYPERTVQLLDRLEKPLEIYRQRGQEQKAGPVILK